MWGETPSHQPPISQTTRAAGPEETILYIFTAWKAECGRKHSRQKQSIRVHMTSESDSVHWFKWFLVTCRGHAEADRLSHIRVPGVKAITHPSSKAARLFPRKRYFYVNRHASPVGYTYRWSDKPPSLYSFNVYPKYTVPNPSIPAENPNPPTAYQIKSRLEIQTHSLTWKNRPLPG